MKSSKKRPWSALEIPSNGRPAPPPPSAETTHAPPNSAGGAVAMYQSSESSSKATTTPPMASQLSPEINLLAVTSRKSTACPACRKQKVSCPRFESVR
ncbi:hypothetical protein AJ80_02725 [Polytolypa hystricis UAMH7299]|uniref:Uncharacterized protein n=1 Tax=Polytolypa hystricis (strain UAMH7299) TaxID=1447883 RepID=A0A2B7YPG7_POLH7|nr:hypothetical protein AJ80_02725 [Polytolypa hystricis UAMH7299]